MNKKNISRIPVKCEYEPCGKIVERTPYWVNKCEHHFCSRQCQWSHLNSKWNEKTLAYIKENLGIINQKEIAKNLNVNYDALKTQLRKWKSKGLIKTDKPIRESRAESYSLFDWQQYRNGVIAADF